MNQNTIGDLPLPEAPQIERLLLGYLMNSFDADEFALVADLLTEEDFFLTKHRRVFNAMRELHGGNRPIGVAAVCQFLLDRGQENSVGGLAYVSDLAADGPARLIGIDGYCRTLMHKALLRKAMTKAWEIMKKCSVQGGTPAELMEESQHLLNVFNYAQRDGLHTISEIIERAGGFNQFCSGSTSEVVVPWLFQSVQMTTGRLFGSELTLLAARPGIGKSATAVQQGVFAASRKFRTAAYVLEMSDSEVVKRCISSLSNVSGSKWRMGVQEPDERNAIAGAASKLVSLDEFFWLSDQANVTTATIAADLRRWQARGKPIQFLIVDYIQLVSATGRHTNREQEVASVSRGLKLIAQEFKIPVLALSQIRREADDRPDRRPQLRDLRESGSLENDANCVMFEWWPKPNPEEKISDICWSIEKQRNGPQNEGVFKFDKRFFRFEDPFGMAAQDFLAA